jgi:hypothetical protein
LTIVLEYREILDPEDRRINTGRCLLIEDVASNNCGENNGDENLPVQLELAHYLPRRLCECMQRVEIIGLRAYCNSSEAASMSLLTTTSACS